MSKHSMSFLMLVLPQSKALLHMGNKPQNANTEKMPWLCYAACCPQLQAWLWTSFFMAPLKSVWAQILKCHLGAALITPDSGTTLFLWLHSRKMEPKEPLTSENRSILVDVNSVQGELYLKMWLALSRDQEETHTVCINLTKCHL